MAKQTKEYRCNVASTGDNCIISNQCVTGDCYSSCGGGGSSSGGGPTCDSCPPGACGATEVNCSDGSTRTITCGEDGPWQTVGGCGGGSCGPCAVPQERTVCDPSTKSAKCVRDASCNANPDCSSCTPDCTGKQCGMAKCTAKDGTVVEKQCGTCPAPPPGCVKTCQNNTCGVDCPPGTPTSTPPSSSGGGACPFNCTADRCGLTICVGYDDGPITCPPCEQDPDKCYNQVCESVTTCSDDSCVYTCTPERCGKTICVGYDNERTCPACDADPADVCTYECTPQRCGKTICVGESNQQTCPPCDDQPTVTTSTPEGASAPSGNCIPCTPDCSGKQCGQARCTDGCGNTVTAPCGTCPTPPAGCVKTCLNNQCGLNCDGSSSPPPATSGSGETCTPCTPNCSGKECGQASCRDSCGNVSKTKCGSCPAPPAGCKKTCSGNQCGVDCSGALFTPLDPAEMLATGAKFLTSLWPEDAVAAPPEGGTCQTITTCWDEEVLCSESTETSSGGGGGGSSSGWGGSSSGGGGGLPQCSDGIDNADFEDTLADRDDPGCYSDWDIVNGTYNPNDNDERDDGSRPECWDGIDNDGDGLIDNADPDCHTDGNPSNFFSWDRNDDDESGAGFIQEINPGSAYNIFTPVRNLLSLIFNTALAR